MRAKLAGRKVSAKESVNPQLTPPAGSRARVVAGMLLITLATLVAYLPSLNGGFIMDDDILLTSNKLVHASDGLYRMWFTTQPLDYWPLTSSSFWLEWRLWGLSPAGYHVTNLILHILAALLIWRIFAKLGFRAGFLAALLFAVHPVNVQSVAWIAERKNTLSMVFFLLSIFAFLKADEQENPTGGWYWLSLVSFVLAMLSKGSVAILPLVLVGLLAWRKRRLALGVWEYLRLAPFFVVAIVFTVVNIWFQTHGADQVIRDVTPLQRLLGAGGVIFFYLHKALAPLNLIFVYPDWRIDPGDWRWWAPLLTGILVTAILIAVFWRWRWRSSERLLLAWAFFVVALIPVMGFTDVGFMKYSLVADHYQYIALISICALLAAGWSGWQRSVSGAAKWLPTAAVAALVGGFIILSWNQSSLYRDPVKLYQATIHANPRCWVAYNNLGSQRFAAGNVKDAADDFRQALAINPNCGDAECNLGNVLIQLSSPIEAKMYLQQGLKLSPQRADSRNNLGHLLLDENQIDEAIACLTEALQIDPESSQANFNLGNALTKSGDLVGAIDRYKQAIRFKPDYAEAHCNLASALAMLGQRQDAIYHFEQAVKYKPDFAQAYCKLGNTLLEMNRFQEAIPAYERAMQLKPDYTQAFANVAMAYLKAGRRADAVAAADRAIELARASGQAALVDRLQQLIATYSSGGTQPQSLPLGQ